ncbi:MAG: N-acetylneuraminate synthase family protein, partial [Planctomycetes bacterium]|nr:N-acetylneuraminate synthase family protein [Planctomycetota bacterium]
MRIGEREIQLGSEPYIIAELGVNHDGSLSRALELVEAAHHAGADAVKLQWFETDRLLSSAARLAQYQQQAGADDPFALLRGLELGPHEMQTIVESAHGLGLHTIVTVFSLELVGPADRLPWDAYKVASPDVINRPLIERLMSTGKPLLVSTGAADAQEIQSATQWMGAPSPIGAATRAGGSPLPWRAGLGLLNLAGNHGQKKEGNMSVSDSESPLALRAGDTVAVTGAARGIGRAIACTLAARGARVAVLDT